MGACAWVKGAPYGTLRRVVLRALTMPARLRISAAVEIAGRVVGASLDAKQHTRLVDEFIDSVGAGSGKGGKRR